MNKCAIFNVEEIVKAQYRFVVVEIDRGVMLPPVGFYYLRNAERYVTSVGVIAGIAAQEAALEDDLQDEMPF